MTDNLNPLCTTGLAENVNNNMLCYISLLMAKIPAQSNSLHLWTCYQLLIWDQVTVAEGIPDVYCPGNIFQLLPQNYSMFLGQMCV